MVHAIIILICLFIYTNYLASVIKKRYPGINRAVILRLFFYHYGFSIIYYIYSLFNPSDSRAYHSKIVLNYRGPDWASFYGTSTTFIEFLGYPLVKFLEVDYLGIIALFSYFGFLGFVIFYIFFKENSKTTVYFFKVDAILLVLFLPNFHFWTASFGKGSIIFFAIAMIFYSLDKIRSRYITLIIGMVLAYHIRPHIMFMILVSTMIGFMLSARRTSLVQKILVFGVGSVVFAYIFNDVLAITGLDEDLLDQASTLSERAATLSRASSGIDISNYNFFEKLFAFLYRPLFIDAPGLLGLFTSVENALLLFLTLKIVNRRFWTFFSNSDYIVKSAFFTFLTVSIALAQITGNLGLAIRQKSQIMMLLLFVIIRFVQDQQARSQTGLPKQQS